MARANTLQTNFTGGEVSPTTRGRTDIVRYQNGAATLKNFIVKPQGGIFARPGTIFLGEIKDSSKRSRLYEFEYSETVNYLLEFGNLYVRIFKNNVYTGVEVVTPYLEADLQYLKFTQSADVLYICHPGYQTRKLLRFSDVSWSLVLFQQSDGPYLAVNDTDTQMAVSNYVDTATITTTADSFVVGDVGKLVEYSKTGIPLLALITAYVGAREVVVTPKDNVIAPIDPVAVLTRGDGKLTSTHAIFSNNNVGSYIKTTWGWELITEYFSETEVGIQEGTHASKDLGTVGTGALDTEVETVADGTAGNSATVEAIATSGAGEGVQITVTDQHTLIEFEDGVSTVADVETAIGALTGTNKVLRVKTAGTGATVLTGADVFGSTALSGGAGSLSVVTTSGTVSLINRSITGTVSSTADVFLSTDVGRHLRLNFSSQQIWGNITAYSGVRQVTVAFDRSIPLKDRDVTKLIDDGLTTLWRLGAWSATTGWPSVVTFHEERLAFAASPLEPQTFWLSVAGDYENFAPTDNESKVLDDNAVTFTIASNKVNAIRWMISGPSLIMGTMGGGWQVSASSTREAITPTNISVVQHTAHGSGHVRPLRVGPAVAFTQKTGTKLRELVYDYQTDSLVARDITIISEHMLKRGGRAVEAAYQQEPNGVAWFALNDGGLAGLTYVRDQEVYAWHYHELGGAFGSGKSMVESVACLPDSSGEYDTLYLIVKRTINGSTKRYIEYMDLEYDPPTDTSRDDLYYVDCGKKVSGAATSSVTLAHLPLQQVSVLADGSARPNITLDGSGIGTFTGGNATKISVGLKYESLLVTLPPEGGGEAGTSQGKTKRLHRAKVRVYKSMGFKYGPSETKLSDYNFRSTNDPMNSGPRIRSEDIPLTMENAHDFNAQMVIKRDQPYPLNILSFAPEFVTNE